MEFTMENKLEVGGIIFDTDGKNKLPLSINGNKINLDDLIEDALLIKNDEERTVREWLEDKDFTIIDDTYIISGDEEDYFITDEETIICKDDCNLIGKSYTYDYCNPQTYAEFYELKDDGNYGVIYDSDTLYIWEDKEEMIRQYSTEIEAFHNGDDIQKEAFDFDDDLITIVEDERNGENSFNIFKEISLDDGKSIAYYFEYIGLTDNDELIYYTVNNCDVCTYDYPKGYPFTIEECRKMKIEMDNFDQESGEDCPNNREYPLPFKHLEEIEKLLKDN